jgi:hypothetical protein
VLIRWDRERGWAKNHANHPMSKFFYVEIQNGVAAHSGKQTKHSYKILFIKVSKREGKNGKIPCKINGLLESCSFTYIKNGWVLLYN